MILADKLYLGSTALTKVYLGETLVFDASDGGGEPGANLHRYWRIKVDSNGDGGGNVSLSILVFYDRFGTEITAAGLAKVQSETFGTYNADGAFDKNPNSVWISSAGPAGAYIGLDMGAGVTKEVRKVTMRADYPPRAPITFRLQYSDDNATWADSAIQQTAQTAWTSGGETRNFQYGAFEVVPIGARRFWRMKIDHTGADGANTSLARIAFFDETGTDNGYAGKTLLSSSVFGTYNATNAFDASNSTVWISSAGAGNAYIGIDYGAGTPKKVESVLMRADLAARAPINFRLQYSDDGVAYTDHPIVIPTQAAWSGTENRTFAYA